MFVHQKLLDIKGRVTLLTASIGIAKPRLAD
jgi:hypothetical protein